MSRKRPMFGVLRRGPAPPFSPARLLAWAQDRQRRMAQMVPLNPWSVWNLTPKEVYGFPPPGEEMVDVVRPSKRFRRLLAAYRGHRCYRIAASAVGMHHRRAEGRIKAFFREVDAMDAPQKERRLTAAGWRR